MIRIVVQLVFKWFSADFFAPNCLSCGQRKFENTLTVVYILELILFFIPRKAQIGALKLVIKKLKLQRQLKEATLLRVRKQIIQETLYISQIVFVNKSGNQPSH